MRMDRRGWKVQVASVRSEYSPWIGLCACIGICALRSGEEKPTALMETDSEIKPASGEAKGLAEKVAELAAKSVMKENTLRYRDSLYHGNALSVYFLNMAGDLPRAAGDYGSGRGYFTYNVPALRKT